MLVDLTMVRVFVRQWSLNAFKSFSFEYDDIDGVNEVPGDVNGNDLLICG